MKTITKLSLGAALMLPLASVVLPGGGAAYAASSAAPASKTIWFTAPVALGSAGYFTILSQAGITDVPSSAIVGNVGTSPITGAADLLTCSEVTGVVDSVNAAGPSPCSQVNAVGLRSAINAMHAAYISAAGRAAQYVNVGTGNIGGLTLAPGVYKWSTGVTIPTDVTLNGSSNSVWIFQIAGDLEVADGKSVILAGSAYARNIFWQVAGQTTLGTTARFQGTILDKTAINLKTGAAIHGRLLAQTAVTLEKNEIGGIAQ